MISWFGKRAKDPPTAPYCDKGRPMNRIRVFPVFGCLELEMERDQRNR